MVYQITSILSDDRARQPTYGPNSPLVLPGRPAAVKTGTTDEYRDSWVVGFTPDLVTGVWVGNTDNTPMKDVLGVVGAGQIWHAFMAGALDGTPVAPFKPPPGLQQAEVCALSGMLPTPECRENLLPIHGVRTDIFVPGVNLPTNLDDWHQRVDVCKVNGKLSTPLVPENARESAVYVNLPAADHAWGAAHGLVGPPTDDCSDVYQGERIAQIVGPAPEDRIVVGQTLQIVGSAYVDDFSNYTLDVGPGDNPSTWTPITDKRDQAVDKALLGVWNTTGLAPGRYRLRLRVFDSFDNSQESQPLIVTLSAPVTPTPLPSATPVAPPTATRAPATSVPTAPTLAATRTAVPSAAASATPQPTTRPNATPRPTVRAQ
jgi:membrane peptidoglycan carboxypeptidase